MHYVTNTYKQLTPMKSFNPMRSITIIVPYEAQKVYIPLPHNTWKDQEHDPWHQAVESAHHYCTVCPKGVEPTYASHLWEERSISCFPRCCILMDKVFPILYLLQTIMGQSSALHVCIFMQQYEASCSPVLLTSH